MKKAEKIAIRIAALGGFFLWLTRPGKDRTKRLKSFEDVYIAHRGLFDNEKEYPENSIPAFQRAVEHGYGIELDVQMTTDGRLVVFHDQQLTRMCGDDRQLTDCSYQELQQLRLAGSGERIPLLDQVLRVIDGKVPLLLEVKYEGDWHSTVKKTAERMDHYRGIWCMESFHPLAVAWMRFHRPDVIRGQLAENFLHEDFNCPMTLKFALSSLMFNFAARPDFISYNYKHMNFWTYRLFRRLFSAEHMAWTVRDPQALKQAEKIFDVIIFDSFNPGRPKNEPAGTP